MTNEMTLHQAQEAMTTTVAANSMLSTREAQEVQAAVFMAKRFPRNENEALARILRACDRVGLATKAVYSYPKGGSKVSGPSVRLAEAMAQAWGNIQSGVVELEQAEPVEAQMPCISRSSRMVSPSSPGKLMFTLPGRRGARPPFRRASGMFFRTRSMT